MPPRSGNWQLLDHDSDPVPGDSARLGELITYYRTMADTITSEARTLQEIGEGNASQLAGKSADAVRARSRDVAGSLSQMAGRYEAVRDALTGFQPELDVALDQSAKALQRAVAAEGSLVVSAGLPNPESGRAPDAAPFTADETAQIHARTTAIDGAADAAGSAKRHLQDALAALDIAGRAARSRIEAAWNDGLVDTTAYKLRENFMKFLKILVKVLMWIGVALAVLAFFIPGLGALALAGAAVAVVAVAASTALAAMGEGSWLDVILGAVSVLLLGVGVLVAKVVQTSHAALLGKALGAAKPGEVVKMTKAASGIAAKRADLFRKGLNGDLSVTATLSRVGKLDRGLVNSTAKITKSSTTVAKDFEVKPQWWNVRHPDYLPNDLGKVTDVLKGNYKWDRLLSVDRVRKYEDLRGVSQAGFGVAGKATPAWHYFNGGRVVYGWGAVALKIGVTPTGVNGDTSRWRAYEDGKTALTTKKV